MISPPPPALASRPRLCSFDSSSLIRVRAVDSSEESPAGASDAMVSPNSIASGAAVTHTPSSPAAPMLLTWSRSLPPADITAKPRPRCAWPKIPSASSLTTNWGIVAARISTALISGIIVPGGRSVSVTQTSFALTAAPPVRLVVVALSWLTRTQQLEFSSWPPATAPPESPMLDRISGSPAALVP